MKNEAREVDCVQKLYAICTEGQWRDQEGNCKNQEQWNEYCANKVGFHFISSFCSFTFPIFLIFPTKLKNLERSLVLDASFTLLFALCHKKVNNFSRKSPPQATHLGVGKIRLVENRKEIQLKSTNMFLHDLICFLVIIL